MLRGVIMCRLWFGRDRLCDGVLIGLCGMVLFVRWVVVCGVIRLGDRLVFCVVGGIWWFGLL